ncbi:GAF domain-containing protein [Aureibacter tunicatorum]|uniref:Methionine-R-sulfoxide reductase with GAF domain n=1 Tax=Aureibacter tunicatorum TaxID=866807 RepID=A0AAE3XPY5_9BACT|nr:GAF domain-containing protein [Aureibacter tunicatorum]MDR6240427.1 putative methionine-R-sulfoxide reductase with GAF domain [Aureibacter tunicatorum]BDD05694.1 hypothetical protein AUTU_31770 [Aureibacter tunicatorum]
MMVATTILLIGFVGFSINTTAFDFFVNEYKPVVNKNTLHEVENLFLRMDLSLMKYEENMELMEMVFEGNPDSYNDIQKHLNMASHNKDAFENVGILLLDSDVLIHRSQILPDASQNKGVKWLRDNFLPSPGREFWNFQAKDKKLYLNLKLFDKQGKPVAILYAYKSIEDFTREIFKNEIGENGHVFIADANGDLLLYNRQKYEERLNNVREVALLEAWGIDKKALRSSSEEFEYQGEQYSMFISSIEGTDFFLISSFSVDEVISPILKTFVFEVMITLGGLSLIFWIVLFVMSKRTSRYLVSLAKTSEKVGRGEIVMADDLRVSNTKEFILLRKSFEQMVDRLREVVDFAQEIGRGNLENKLTVKHDKDEMAKALMQMRDALKGMRKETAHNQKLSQAIADFSEILRLKHNDLDMLANEALNFIIHFVNAAQGGLFVHRKDSENGYLELAAMYAYDKKKHLHMKIEEGDGLVGQVFRDKEGIYLTDLPEEYIQITSGLGNVNPSSLIVVPIMHNNTVQGVLELASFHVMGELERKFVDKAVEAMSSSIAMTLAYKETQRLLEQSENNKQRMEDQEVDLRQNLEELSVTQEEMRKMELVSRKKNRHLEVFMNFQQELCLSVDKEYRVMFISPALQTWLLPFGFKVNEGDQIKDAIPEISKEFWMDILEVGMRGYHKEITDRMPSTKLMCKISVVPVYHEGGVDGVILLVNNISEDIIDQNDSKSMLELGR